MYVRLAFAVAAHLEPEILLVDEVLAVGDAEFQKKCLGKIGEVAKGGRTVLVVSHSMPLIINLCQHAVLLSAGEKVASGFVSDVVKHYLSEARSAGGEVVWTDPSEAPGNDLVRLQAVRILQDGVNGSTADVDISKEVLIEISYWNLRDGLKIYPAIWLRDHMGTLVLSSTNANSISLTKDPWWDSPHPKGLFESFCRIPGNFLNEGIYSVAAILGLPPANTQVLKDYVLSFTVHDTGEMRKEYYGGWGGTVRPRLAWSTDFVGNGKVGEPGTLDETSRDQASRKEY
jgi:lipopolysaccharide transport system ATP-binding protein